MIKRECFINVEEESKHFTIRGRVNSCLYLSMRVTRNFWLGVPTPSLPISYFELDEIITLLTKVKTDIDNFK